MRLGDIRGVGSSFSFVGAQAFPVRLRLLHWVARRAYCGGLGVGVGFEGLGPGRGVSVGLGPIVEPRARVGLRAGIVPMFHSVHLDNF